MSTHYEVTIRTNNPDLIPAYLDADGNFCFNKLIPMPESLNIESGSKTDRAIAYYVTERLTIPVEQTNLVNMISNMFCENWAAEVVSRVAKTVEAASAEEMDTLYEMGKQYVFNRENYGCYTWYEWCTANWGTKWDALETEFDFADPCSVSFWVPGVPFGIFEKLCSTFPEAEINFSVFCVGEWENDHGRLVDVDCEDEEDDFWEEDDFEDDAPFEDDALICMEKVDHKIHTYAVRDGFWADIIEQQNVWECYLYHEARGIKLRVMTLPKESYVLSDVESIFASDMNEQKYLLEYRMEFMR